MGKRRNGNAKRKRLMQALREGTLADAMSTATNVIWHNVPNARIVDLPAGRVIKMGNSLGVVVNLPEKP